MYAKRIDGSERGVSPVVGVVLMVGITVILAATAATFFFQINEQAVDAPTAGFSFEYESGSSDELEITHQSGDTLDSSNIYVRVSGASFASGGDPNGEYDFHALTGGPAAGSEIRAGTTGTVDDSALGGGSDLDLSDATVNIVWKSPAEKKTIVLDSWEN